MINLYQIFSLKNFLKGLTPYLVLLLAFTVCTTPSFSASAQTMTTMRVSFTAKNQSIKSVFKIIEQKTPFIIGYNSTSFDADRIVNISADNELVVDVLKDLIKGYHGTIKQVDETHVLLQVQKEQPASKTKEKMPEVKTGVHIMGTVTDEKGEALVGVSVSVKGTTAGTMTNTEGKYELNTDENAILVFQYIGYDSQEMPVKGQSSIGVILKACGHRVTSVKIGVLCCFGQLPPHLTLDGCNIHVHPRPHHMYTHSRS